MPTMRQVLYKRQRQMAKPNRILSCQLITRASRWTLSALTSLPRTLFLTSSPELEQLSPLYPPIPVPSSSRNVQSWMHYFPSKMDFLIIISDITIFRVVQTQELGVSFHSTLFLLLNSATPSYWSLHFVIFRVPSSALVTQPHTSIPGARCSHMLALVTNSSLSPRCLALSLPCIPFPRNLPEVSLWSCHSLAQAFLSSQPWLSEEFNCLSLTFAMSPPLVVTYCLSSPPGSPKIYSLPRVPFANAFSLLEMPSLPLHSLPPWRLPRGCPSSSSHFLLILRTYIICTTHLPTLYHILSYTTAIFLCLLLHIYWVICKVQRDVQVRDSMINKNYSIGREHVHKEH